MKNQEALEIVLKQWDHMAINDCSKYEAIKELKLPYDMIAECSLCDLAGGRSNNCIRCLINWPLTFNRKSPFPCKNSYFGQWEKNVIKGYLADSIAELALAKLNELFPEEV